MYKYYIRNQVKILAGPFDTPEEARQWIPPGLRLEIVKIKEVTNKPVEVIHYQTVKK